MNEGEVMAPETTISITFLMTVILFCFHAINFFSNRKKDTKEESRELIKANIKLEQICSITNETRSDIKAMNNQIEKINQEQIKQRLEINTIWKRIDELKER